MKIIPIANGSGSAGKTTTAVTIAALAAADGHKVLLIDGDGQGTATMWLGLDDDSRDTIAAAMGDRRVSLDDLAVATEVPGLDLIPASRHLDADLARVDRYAVAMRLRSALAPTTRWDTVIIDCPGSVSDMTIAALVAATAVVTVTTPSRKEVLGVIDIQGHIATVARDLNADCELKAIVPCAVPPKNQGRVYLDNMADLEAEYGDLITSPVRKTAKVPEAFERGLPVTIWTPNAAVSDDYRAVYATLLDRGIL